MKIGVLCYPTFGGSGVVATELGMALAKKGHQVHFISYKQPVRLGTFNENVFFHEVVRPDYALFEETPYESSLVSTIVDVATFASLDVLHVHYAIPHAAVAYLSKKVLEEQGVHLPVVTTLHGTDITLVGKTKVFAPIVEFSINQSDAVTSVSESLKAQTLDTFDISRPIDVVPNFIDFERFRIQDKSHFKKVIAPSGEKIVIHISNFRKVKRIKDVIEVFRIIRENMPSKLLLVGDGPERQKYEQVCRELEICDDVHFLGKQNAVEELLSVSDLFILPSEKESFGLAALEALACGVPLITSNVGGLPEVNAHGFSGYLSEVGEVKEMAENALKILSSEATHEAFKRNAIKQARKFSLEDVVLKYESIYRKTLEKSTAKEVISQ